MQCDNCKKQLTLTESIKIRFNELLTKTYCISCYSKLGEQFKNREVKNGESSKYILTEKE